MITGSSSFNIEQETGEPLTGRKRTIALLPLAQQELNGLMNKSELRDQLESFLIYGTYPEVYLAQTKKDKIELLLELTRSYLLKDIFTLSSIRGTRQIIDLLKLLAFQIGSEVSVNEIATQIAMDAKTVAKYLDILERAFVIKRVTPYNTNLRKEVTSKNKYYFYDNGTRNALITQFNSINDRNDIGQLFENFIMIERVKFISNTRLYRNMYFWRTYSGQEIDLIEEYDGTLYPHQIKWNEKSRSSKTPMWFSLERSEPMRNINRQNYLEFLL